LIQVKVGRAVVCFESMITFRGGGPKMPARRWTKDELKRAREMYAAGYFHGEIDKALRRRAGSTKRQFEGVGYGSGQKKLIPDVLFVEREALRAARKQRTLTQDFCGDPPPGYSALHGKTGLR
jgi:hypothetical protein